MAKIYGALEVAQLEWFTDAGKPAASSYIYRVIYVNDLKQVQVSDGTNWIPFLNTSTNQTVNGNITFAGQQIFTGLHRLSVTTDSSSTGAVTALNNVTPVIEFTGAVTSISGIVNSASGATVMLVNRTGSTLAILDEDAGATAANRIRTGTGAQVALANNASIILTYVGDNRWHIVGGSGSGSGSAGINYITNGSAEADTLGWAVYAESDAVTFQDTGDTVTLNSHGLSNGNQISFTSIVSTTGISTNTLYFVISATTNTFQVATTATGSALPLTTNGSGTMVRFAPKVGTGGSANVTITRTTTTPLVGTASFLLAKDAANRQGQGWSYDFTIDLANRAKVLQISFDYLVSSGTFVAGATGSDSDVTVWIYDITNAVLIQPSNIKLFSNNASITDKFQASFQTASNSSSYRLILHVASTSASAYTLKFDGVSVSPSNYVFGTPVTDWQSYTPTFTGFGTPTAVTAYWRRVGDSVQLSGTFTAGTSTGTQAQMTLPNGITVDTNKIFSTAIVGTGAFNNVNSAAFVNILASGSNNYVMFGLGGSASYSGGAPQNANVVATSGQTVEFYATIPITGWSSSVQTSDQTDTRVVAARIGGAPANTSANGIIIFPTVLQDTHGAYNTTTGQYKIPVPGFYQVTAYINAAFPNGALYASLDTVQQVPSMGYVFNSVGSGSGTTTVYANAGQLLDVRFTQGCTGFSSTVNGLAITRVSGPSAIAATETVAASYWASANGTCSTTTAINFDTKDFDTHNAVATGANWKFTAPISGIYSVSLFTNQVTGVTTYYNIYKNSTTTLYKSLAYTTSAIGLGSGMTSLRLNAGDYIGIYPDTSVTYRGNPSLSVVTISYVLITRTGN